MAEYALTVGTALWLGILTSVSPCPLATNIAAISYIARGIEKPRVVLLSGVLYTLGRVMTYVGLGVLVVYSLHSAPFISNFLQKYMNKILGPLLVVLGMFLLGLVQARWPGSGGGVKYGERIAKFGPWGAALLGLLFALSFCPVSAALFFGALVPLAVQSNSGVFMPSLYGIGTAIPVVAFATLIAVSTRSVGKAYSSITLIDRWARRATGVIFIGVGIYLTLVYIFGLSL